MACKSCRSEHVHRFTGEIAIQFPGPKKAKKPVWVFPELTVCLNCGTAEFVIPEGELRLLAKGGAASASYD